MYIKECEVLKYYGNWGYISILDKYSDIPSSLLIPMPSDARSSPCQVLWEDVTSGCLGTTHHYCNCLYKVFLYKLSAGDWLSLNCM